MVLLIAECIASFVIINRTAYIFPSVEEDEESFERLLNDGVCDGGNLPALLTVNKGIKIKLRIINQ